MSTLEPAKVGTMPELIIRDLRSTWVQGHKVKFKRRHKRAAWENGLLTATVPHWFITLL